MWWYRGPFRPIPRYSIPFRPFSSRVVLWCAWPARRTHLRSSSPLFKLSRSGKVVCLSRPTFGECTATWPTVLLEVSRSNIWWWSGIQTRLNCYQHLLGAAPLVDLGRKNAFLPRYTRQFALVPGKFCDKRVSRVSRVQHIVGTN
jgi:hypothetical protein